MGWRGFRLLASQGIAAVLVWLIWTYLLAPGSSIQQQCLAALVGTLIGGWIWWLVDSWNGARLLRWLRQSELSDVPNLVGVWSEAGVRMRRWIRQSVQQVQQGDQRLNDILSALQASPNGVVLLDAQGVLNGAIRYRQSNSDLMLSVMYCRASEIWCEILSSALILRPRISRTIWSCKGVKARLRARSSYRCSSMAMVKGASCCWPVT